MKFEVPNLPYAKDALAPHISERTVEIHYEKHHKGYMKKLDAALEAGDARRDASLEDLVRTSEGKVFNCAAQVWNHSFYWNSLSPNPKTPSKELMDAIENSFASFDALKSELKSVAAGEFGSGWGWLICNNKTGELAVTSTTDAENPLPDDITPLLTLDVWEHAYYLDYQNERGRYLDALIEHLLNWEFASANFARAK